MNPYLGMVVVHGAYLLLVTILIRLRILDQRDSKQNLGLYSAIGPVSLLAWRESIPALAIILPLPILGAVLLLLGGANPRLRRG